MYAGNVKQVLNVSQIFALKMIQDKIGGAIVNISSQVGTFYPPPLQGYQQRRILAETTYRDVIDHSFIHSFSFAAAKLLFLSVSQTI